MIRDLDVQDLLLLTADVDDESPQVLATIPTRALSLGARDAVLVPIVMKKGRAATRIEILTEPPHRDLLLEFLLRETSTLGVRCTRVERFALRRIMSSITIRGERIAIKVATADGAILRAMPEFSDCEAAATALDLPLRQVMDEARAEALRQFPAGTPSS